MFGRKKRAGERHFGDFGWEVCFSRTSLRQMLGLGLACGGGGGGGDREAGDKETTRGVRRGAWRVVAHTSFLRYLFAYTGICT